MASTASDPKPNSGAWRRRLVLGVAVALASAAACLLGWNPARPGAHAAVSPVWPPTQVTAPSGVYALAAGGSTIIYALSRGNSPGEECSALRVWSITSRSAFAPARPDCGSEFSGFGDLAVAGEEVIWSQTYESNHTTVAVFAAPASHRGRATSIDFDYGGDGYIGALAADGAVVAFSTQEGEYGGGADASLWVGSPRVVRVVRHVTGWMDSVSAGGDLVAVGYRNGRVEIFRTSGRRVRSFPPGTASHGIHIESGRLLALTEKNVFIRDIRSGNVVRSWTLRRGEDVRLEDAQKGLLVYRSGRDVRLLRLSDGHDVRLPVRPANPDFLHARFGSGGLAVAYGRVVKLLPWATLGKLLPSR